MKWRWLKWLFLWCLPGLLSLALLNCPGCFSAIGGLAIRGPSPSTAEVVAVGAVDVLTFPIQFVVLAPLLLCDHIYANTGDRKRAKEERVRYEAEVKRYQGILEKDFGKVYEVEDYLSLTNAPAHEALLDWLRNHSRHSMTRPEVDRFAARVFVDAKHLLAFQPFLFRPEVPQEMKEKAFSILVKDCRERKLDERKCDSELYSLKSLMPDSVLQANLSATNDVVDQVVRCELERRVQRRENERRWKEEAVARQKREREEKLLQEKKWREERLRRIREAKALAERLDGPASEFKAALSVRGEAVVGSLWRERLRDRSRPLPVENLRMLAEAELRPGEKMNDFCAGLFRRSELTTEDLRKFYPKLLAKVREVRFSRLRG